MEDKEIISRKVVLNKILKHFHRDNGVDSYKLEDFQKHCEKKEINFDEVIKVYNICQDIVEGEIVLKKVIETYRGVLEESYYLIKNILKRYVDMKEEYYNITALWILGTYLHKQFNSYPYLFFNASKGSGKSRLLKLMKELCWNGKLVASQREAVLFRTAKNNTLLIDEFEKVASKEKQALREILNAAYKKGIKVERVSKKTTKEGEKYIIDEFDVYCPISMANIWGMEDVLADRCLTLVLEKSGKREIVKLIETFENDHQIRELKKILSVLSVGSVVSVSKNIYVLYTVWNYYIKYTNTLNTLTTLTTLTTLELKYLPKLIDFYKEIDEKGSSGRNLELSFPLLFVAYFCSDEVVKESIESLKTQISEKEREDRLENKDNALLKFLGSRKQEDDFVRVIDLAKEYAEYMGEERAYSQSMGRALKRLGVVFERRRMGKGIEVRLNYVKIRDKMNILGINLEVPKETEVESKYQRIDAVFLPCVECGATSTKGWTLEDPTGKIYCDVCAGQI